MTKANKCLQFLDIAKDIGMMMILWMHIWDNKPIEFTPEFINYFVILTFSLWRDYHSTLLIYFEQTMVEVCFLLRKVLISSTLLSQFNSNTNYQNLGRIYTSINSLDHSNIHHTVGVFPFYHPVDFKSMSITFYIKNNDK